MRAPDSLVNGGIGNQGVSHEIAADDAERSVGVRGDKAAHSHMAQHRARLEGSRADRGYGSRHSSS